MENISLHYLEELQVVFYCGPVDFGLDYFLGAHVLQPTLLQCGLCVWLQQMMIMTSILEIGWGITTKKKASNGVGFSYMDYFMFADCCN
eukprot:m.208693 g.208693  ORF g.208693 m.208693 type:complete len:89 (-) comp16932_c1_seq2:897-1163(-)